MIRKQCVIANAKTIQLMLVIVSYVIGLGVVQASFATDESVTRDASSFGEPQTQQSLALDNPFDRVRHRRPFGVRESILEQLIGDLIQLASSQSVREIRMSDPATVDARLSSECRLSSRVLAAIDLARLLDTGKPGTVRRIEQAADRLRKSIADDDARELYRVVRRFPGSRASIIAAWRMVAMAGGSHANWRWEQTEAAVLKLLQSKRRSVRAISLIMLGTLYQLREGNPGEATPWRSQVESIGKVLLDRYADVRVSGGAKDHRVVEWVSQRFGVESNAIDSPTARNPHGRWRLAWRLKSDQAYSIGLDARGRFADSVNVAEPLLTLGDPSAYLRESMLLLASGTGALRMVSTHDVTTRWTINLPGDANQPPLLTDASVSSYRGTIFPSGRIIRDRHTGFLIGRDQIHAIGLVTGKLLWRRPINPIADDTMRLLDEQERGQTLVSVGSGCVAIVDTLAKTVTVVDSIDGSTMWQRRFNNDIPIAVHVSASTVHVVMQGAQQIVSFHRSTGEVFKGAVGGGMSIADRVDERLSWHGGLVAIKTADRLKLIALPAGATKVNLHADGQSDRCGFAGGRYFWTITGLSNDQARVNLFDAMSGDFLRQIKASAYNMFPSEVAVDSSGRRMYVQGIDAEANRRLLIMDIAAHRLVRNIGWPNLRTRSLPVDDLAELGEFIPVAVQRPVPGGGNWRIRFVRESTGRIDEALTLKVPSMGDVLRLAVVDGLLLVVTDVEWLAFRYQ